MRSTGANVHRISGVAAALLALSMSAGAGLAQIPRPQHPPDSGQGGMPGLPAMPAPVVLDTARADLTWADGTPEPIGVFVVPDTVGFGDIAAVVCVFPAGTTLPTRPETEAEWLDFAEGVSGEHLDRLHRLAGAAYPREGGVAVSELLVPVRAYRTDPFVLDVGPVATAVIHVRGRTTDLSRVMDVRNPRSPGWNLWLVVLLALLATALLVSIRRLVTRRTRTAPLEDWRPPEPGWIAAAGRLRDLLDAGELDRGRGREFLNELASIARGFVGERFGVPAREMTGPEIVASCAARGYPAARVRPLARLVEEADRRRYDPEPVDARWCRARAALLIESMAEERVMPRCTEVPAETRFAAEQAWSRLRDLARDAGAAVPGSGPVAGEGA